MNNEEEDSVYLFYTFRSRENVAVTSRSHIGNKYWQRSSYASVLSIAKVEEEEQYYE